MVFSSRMDSALERAIKAAGGPAALARICSQHPQAVSRWRREGQPPAKHCLAIEAATGVTRYELRPDVFGNGPASTDLESAA